MPKKKSRFSNLKPAGPDDPIYTGRFQVYTPYQGLRATAAFGH
jgi:hypothetical protein